MKKNIEIIIMLTLTIFFSGCTNQEDLFLETGNKYNINHKTLRSICKTESNFHANVINVNKSLFDIQKGPHYFSNSISANLYMDYVLDPLLLNYDIGLCQINKTHLARLKLDNEDLLDEGNNIDVAGKIYKYNLGACDGDLMCALSMYNTGRKSSTVGRRYANKVLKSRKSLYGY